MMEHIFTSGIADSIDAFVKQKQAIGYPYQSSSRILHHFDNMIAREFPDANCITKPICDRWLAYKPDEHPNGLLRRITPVRQLAKYMNGIGIPSYILPGHIPDRQIRYEAHIFTEQELAAFFRSIDTCPDSVYSPLRRYVIPVIFRLLFCCGLRSSEARTLDCDDVDLTTGQVMIRESKGWKARIIYVSDDLLSLLIEYDDIMQKKVPNRKPFFPNRQGTYYAKCALDTWFHEFWDHLPEASQYVGNKPRVHDFRHTFAVHTLEKQLEEGYDPMIIVPRLAAYLGHKSYRETCWYIHLTIASFPELAQKLDSAFAGIIPVIGGEIIEED